MPSEAENDQGGVSSPIGPETLAAWQSMVGNASAVLIGTHLNPDGDALGSALAVSHYLDHLGVSNEVVCHHPPPRNLRFLPGVGRVRQVPAEEKHDLGIVVDLDAVDRLGSTQPYFATCDRLILIDHHVPHERPGDLRMVDTSASATAVIVAQLLFALGANVTPQMATCLLTGIVTDTGSFRFRNTNPQAFALAGSLLACGADLSRINEEVFQSKPVASARLLGIVLETMRLEAGERIAWSAVGSDDFLRYDAKDEDTEGFVNELLAIETVRISALVREPKPGKLRVSLRSRGDLDVASVARAYGGGGHRNAAGCTIEGRLDDAMPALVGLLKACLESS